MNDQPSSALGRRDVLRRAALVGGAVVWTTPVVQSLGGVALAAQTSEHQTNDDECVPSLFCWLEWLEEIFCLQWTLDCRRHDDATSSNLTRGVKENPTYFGAFSSISTSFSGRYGSGRFGASADCTRTESGLHLSFDTDCVLKAWFLCSYPTDCTPASTPSTPDCHWAQADDSRPSGDHHSGGLRSRSLLAAPQLSTPQLITPSTSSSASMWGPALPTSSSACDFTFA